MSSKDFSPKMEKWRKWMRRIETDIRTVLSHHHMLCEVADMIIKNPDLPEKHIFYGCWGNMRLTYVLIGLRRQVKPDKDSITFIGLLKEIEQTPEELSWEYYSSVRNDDGEVAQCEFREYANPSSLTYICRQKVKADIEKLESISAKHTKFTNKRIAHLDKRELKAIPTYEELNACLRLLERKYLKYKLLFFAEGDNTLLPPLAEQWKEIFRKPWLV